MRTPLVFTILTATAIAALTWTVGWWTVPLVAAVAGAVHPPNASVAWRTALAAAIGWNVLLLIDAMSASIKTVATPLAATMHVPAFVLVVVTLAFPTLLAWSGATIGQVARWR